MITLQDVACWKRQRPKSRKSPAGKKGEEGYPCRRVPDLVRSAGLGYTPSWLCCTILLVGRRFILCQLTASQSLFARSSSCSRALFPFLFPKMANSKRTLVLFLFHNLELLTVSFSVCAHRQPASQRQSPTGTFCPGCGGCTVRGHRTPGNVWPCEV